MTEILSRNSAVPGTTRRKYPPVAKGPAAQRQKSLESHKKVHMGSPFRFQDKPPNVLLMSWSGVL